MSAFSLQVTTSQQWRDAKSWQTQDINNTTDPQKKYRLGTVKAKQLFHQNVPFDLIKELNIRICFFIHIKLIMGV